MVDEIPDDIEVLKAMVRILKTNNAQMKLRLEKYEQIMRAIVRDLRMEVGDGR